jgi:hypothetical protein
MDIFGRLPEDPGNIVGEIRAEVRRLEKDGRPDWNRRIKEVLRNLGKRNGYLVYPDPERKVGEWLLDVIWFDEETGAVRLALESELGKEAEVLDDFQKLLCIKAPLKIMIYYVYKGSFVEKFAEYITRFDQNVEGEYYLLIEFAPGPADRAYFYQVPHGRLAKVEFERLPGP